MDYIKGETLKSLVQRCGPISEAKVTEWAIEICDILKYLHDQDPPIIFRDLKPDNIMLMRSGEIKLIDFGIARHFKAEFIKDTTAYGSIGFAPPEQYGQNQTDIRSDIYAFGATLHYLLIGIDPSNKPFTFELPGNLGYYVCGHGNVFQTSSYIIIFFNCFSRSAFCLLLLFKGMAYLSLLESHVNGTTLYYTFCFDYIVRSVGIIL